ncbi:TPA: UDP-glucose/GDP-mannose dehydrogenase family protein [Candidatus Woesearchaeota archaeon]|nr:UDP-glucose/GDP-mannose dehydrogenase family protein [Candidatus Woesearchaeota archaeon]HIG93600.1 UDP-glucose/GDP-mannose dehydrogenase family protein [Candidatus Woesearchaeota archaeon]HIH12257.1 UDP-glucose/GDP-mannose dehydrogenase family protein [Candidatus Woesearchaeota archaeon]
MKISIFGTGYVGLVTGASLANLGHEVVGIDIDPQKVKVLQQGEIPFYEPGLKELVQSNQHQGRLRFTTDFQQGILSAEAIFNCVGTPSNVDGSADLRFVLEVTSTIAKYSTSYQVLINKSTVPPGTARRCTALIRQLNPSSQVEVVSNPEFLKQGNAVYDFNHPDKIVVGAQSEKAFQVMQKVYHGLVKTYIPLIETIWETAEMIKYANNSFLATKISFINEIANICDAVHADVKIVAKAMGMDQRIGPKFLNAGIGYGGSCFPKDVCALYSTAHQNGYQASFLEEVDAFNERQKSILVPRILKAVRAVNGDTVTVWGLSFKPKTSDVRGAPSLLLVPQLKEAGLSVKVYDPVAQEEARKILGEGVTYCSSITESVINSDAIILVTEWDEFRNVDFTEMGLKMKNRIIFDGRNIYEPDQLRQGGFEYYGIGRGSF